MAYKLYAREVFETEVNGKKYIFTCYTQNTSYGFRHICTKGYNNTSECKWVRKDILGKACYDNRTWECFRYQTVLREAIRNLDEDKQTKEDLNTILVEREEIKRREQAEQEVKEFETLWNGLTEKNKQHIRNGLGDNLIQTEEQAKAVTSVMKMMTLFQNMED